MSDLNVLTRLVEQLNGKDWLYPNEYPNGVPRVEIRNADGSVANHLIIAKHEDSGALAVASAVVRAFARGELVPAAAGQSDQVAAKNFSDFEAGFALACLQVVTLHGEEGIAADVLIENGISEAALDSVDLTEDDEIALAKIRHTRAGLFENRSNEERAAS